MEKSEKKPFVSVLIITYNYEKELLRALDAVASQTFTDYEVIIVDDCSKDNTIATVEEFMKAHPAMEIKLLKHTENRGIVSARNTALDAASGEYCYMHDADDWMDADCLEVLTAKAKETYPDRVIAEFRDVDTNGKVLQTRTLAKEPNHWLCMMHDGCLYKRSTIVENAIRYEEGCWDDLVFNFKFSCKSQTAEFIHKPVFNYYINPKSTSGSSSMKNNAEIQRFEHLISLLNREKKDLDNNNLMYAEYFVIKYYYAAVLQEGREMKYKALLDKYKRLRQVMKENNPHYLKNRNIHFFRENGERGYGRKIVWTMAFLEKVHLFKAAVWGYLMLSKVVYFRV